MVLTFYQVHEGNVFFIRISKQMCNNAAGPCLVGHETEMGEDISRKWLVPGNLHLYYSDFVCAT